MFAAALVAAVLDGVKSIAASEIVVTPLAATWTAAAPDSLAAVQASLSNDLGQPWLWELISAWVLSFPTALALALIGFGLIALGRKTRREVLDREFAI